MYEAVFKPILTYGAVVTLLRKLGKKMGVASAIIIGLKPTDTLSMLQYQSYVNSFIRNAEETSVMGLLEPNVA